MINFVFPHHSLASYLLYEKTGKTITRGYSIDLAGGPPQNVMLWRNFAALSRATEVADAERGKGEEHRPMEHGGVCCTGRQRTSAD